MAEVVDRYFDALGRHDWPAMRACLADGFTRRGPYAEQWFPDPDSYVAYLAGVLPGYVDHTIDVTRVVEQGDAVHAEWTERLGPPGARTMVRVCVAIDLDAAGRIARMEVFLRKANPDES